MSRFSTTRPCFSWAVGEHRARRRPVVWRSGLASTDAARVPFGGRQRCLALFHAHPLPSYLSYFRSTADIAPPPVIRSLLTRSRPRTRKHRLLAHVDCFQFAEDTPEG